MGLLELLHVFSSSKIEGIVCLPVWGVSGRVFVAGQKPELSHSGHSPVQRAKVHPLQPQLSLSGTMVLSLGKLLNIIKKE